MQNIEGIGCNLPNVLSRVLRVRDTSQRVIKSVVIPEGDLEYMIAKLLDRTQILNNSCLLYTSPSPRDKRQSRMPSSA